MPGKNKARLHGRPLYAWTVKAALAAGVFSAIIFSTDDGEIIEELKGQPQLIVDARPKKLADAQASMWEVGEYVLGRYPAAASAAGSVCFITPCHPFRTAGHISQAFQRYTDSAADALVSVTEFPSPPSLFLELVEGRLKRNWEGLIRGAEHPTRYYPNGAITIIDQALFRVHKNPYSSHTIGFEMDWPDCLDIDQPKDLELARRLAPLLLGAGDAGGTR
ncbi:MAG: hypothetical protein JRC92_10635 [Deltaproteobacteria bacterium]|nr:hypothetical protein [Deltaproteobacteria bacterium]